MKKKILVSVMAIIVAFGAGMGIHQMTKTSSAASLSIEEARKIAEQQFPGEVVEISLEKNGNRAVYEMEIKGDGQEYELILDGETGDVIKLEQKASAKIDNEKQSGQSKKSSDQADDQKQENTSGKKSDDDTKSKPSQNEPEDQPSNQQKDDDHHDDKDEKQDKNNDSKSDGKGNQKSDDDPEAVRFEQPKKEKLPIIQAKAIEIARAEINFDGKVEEVELSDDDGQLFYEIEMVSATHEADIEIDAYTGAVLSISTEREED
ncbi:PepSY domain-containing protein [Virgibacillus sp. MSP4-1]|uniref:PepSY domain-containing protein n=1 Tax=Virgibacillus sp. MSP4-1 TaxID=2700081 RepID=UPI00039EA34F|nr:PepSY domain-containing protein [Virgibacillus sp. MSP4-1]QHS24024.1 PepSY domain-containing protein [Virgibacillus sp. MSP4-1]